MARHLYRLLEQLDASEQAAACRDTGHSAGALADVFLYHAGVKWRVRESVLPSHVRGGHVIQPVAKAATKRIAVEVVGNEAGKGVQSHD